MQPQSDPSIFVLLNHPPLAFLVIGYLEMVTLFRYPLLIEKCQFRLLLPHSKHTVRRIRLETIGEGFPCPLSLSSVTYSSTYETLNLELSCGCSLQLHVLGLVRSLGKVS